MNDQNERIESHGMIMIEWRGGDRPVSADTLVDICLRDGDEEFDQYAGHWDWDHGWMDADIVAYRICETGEEAPANDGGPAFPAGGPSAGQPKNTGMSLRDWFAGQALVGLLANQDGEQYSGNVDVFMDAYEHADAMLAERARGEAVT